MVIKVRGGTRSASECLCRTCRRGQVMKGAADSDVRIYCRSINGFVERDIVECNEHSDRSKTSIHDLYETAWILETSKSNRAVGFLPYREWNKKHRDESAVPGY